MRKAWTALMLLICLIEGAAIAKNYYPSDIVIRSKVKTYNHPNGALYGIDPMVSRDYWVKGDGKERTMIIPYSVSGGVASSFRAGYARVVVTSGTVFVKWWGPSQGDTTSGAWISALSDSVANSFEIRTPVDSLSVETKDTSPASSAAHVYGVLY